MTVPARPTGSLDGLLRWAYDAATAINNLHPRAKGRFWKEVSGAVSLEKEWTFVLCDTSGGACTPTLPTGAPKDHEIVIQDKGSAGSNNITITRGGSDTINGANTLVVSTNYGRRTLVCDGSGAWYAA